MTETRALLLTDVVDSTLLVERLGDAAAAELGAAHDRAARDLLREWRGREIDKTDGMLMLFEHAPDAVGYAIAYHRALAALPVPLQARAGLHVGPVILRRNPPRDVAHGAKPIEVEGLAKPLAARVMSLALGGQTLLTREARDALGAAPGWRVQPHGHWRVKGLAEPVELFEIGDASAPFTPPPDSAKVYCVLRDGELWLPRREVRHSLPAVRDAFVGRREALAALARRFDDGARLVSVLGIGGSGKTRLAVRFGWTWLGDYPGGVWFCDLSSARDEDGVAQIVARALDVPLGTDDPVGQLCHALAGRRECLLILDNFEQIARQGARAVGRWLDAAPELRVLVTTRELLGLSGEQALPLPPLPDEEAVRLFRQRAAAAKSGYQSSEADRAAIDRLVGLLDGLPLAIELAAARARVMSPAAMVARMGERFKLLASQGGRHDRQATLRATFDWSWDLLTDVERAALAQLSVFEGGFTLEAAEGVLDLSACASHEWPVDVVHALVDKSFLHFAKPDRLDLLSSVQAYAAEHLGSHGRYPGSGEAARDAARVRHCAWFASMGPARAVEHGGAELPNLVVACRRAVRTGAVPLAVGALVGAWAALSRFGPFSTGVELAAAVCALDGLGGQDAARAHAVHGRSLESLGRPEAAAEHYELALQHARASGDLACQSGVLTRLALLRASDGQMTQARADLETALALAVDADDAEAECEALTGLANVQIDQGHLEAARAGYEQALGRAREAADERWQCSLLGGLSMVHANAGRLGDAHDCLDRALELAQRLGDRQRECSQLCNLGMLHLVQRQIEASIRCSEQALRVARDLGHKELEAIIQCNLALGQIEIDRLPEAMTNLEAASRTMRELRERRYEGQILGYLGRALAKQGRFDAARRSFDDGQSLLRDCMDPLSLGILLCDRARCEWQAGSAAACLSALGEARSIAASAEVGPDSELGQAVASVEALVCGPPTGRPPAS
jgi:predicted ATPase/class 3 adenylate cyclase/tetratricopeptide (TPR) repeat protein